MLTSCTGKVIQKELLNQNIYRFLFKIEGNAELNFQAGQYLMFEIDGKYRMYSISSSPDQRQTIEILVDVSPKGLATTYSHNLQINDIVFFKAPAGVFVLKNQSPNKMFLATGTGIAPMKSMITELLKQNYSGQLRLFWGLKTYSDVYLENFWQDLKTQHPNFDYQICLSRENVVKDGFFFGHVQDAILNFKLQTLNLLEYEFYLCGRPQIIDGLKQELLTKFFIPETQIFHEKFT